MAKNLFVIAILSVSLVACESAVEPTKDDQAKTEKKQEKKKEKEVIKIAVEANRVLTMDLDGMVCSMGCGGSIRKGLNATGAVADCDFDFENDRVTNVATIQFDKDKITADEIVKIVSEINDGQFAVGKTSSEEFVSESKVNEVGTSSSRPSHAKIKVLSNTSFRVPNIFDLFSGLLSF
ncbi:MAG: heavy-metal-associated domain-containing protein [Crocinitomicaceae bacterium]|nr:heavy-metal-associated domain-containing protein [Crocinitomicaceae bacterium]